MEPSKDMVIQRGLDAPTNNLEDYTIRNSNLVPLVLYDMHKICVTNRNAKLIVILNLFTAPI